MTKKSKHTNQLRHSVFHDVHVLPRYVAGLVERQALFHLFTQLVTKHTCGYLWKRKYIHKKSQEETTVRLKASQRILWLCSDKQAYHHQPEGWIMLTKNMSIIASYATGAWMTKAIPLQQRSRHSPEKQSMREAMVQLFARYLEMHPLFFWAARPMKAEWKMSLYLGVFPRVFRALL